MNLEDPQMAQSTMEAQLRQEIKGWHLDKNNFTTPLLNESTQALVMASYHDLVHAILDAHKQKGERRDEKSWKDDWEKAQIGVASVVLSRLENSGQILAFSSNREIRHRTAMRLTGSILLKAIQTTAKLNVSATFNHSLFGMTTSDVRQL